MGRIFLNATVISDLRWLADTIPKAIGVRFLDEGLWPDLEANVTVWTDANLRDGLAFSFSNNGFVYQQQFHDSCMPVDIFFLELVAILSAIHHLASLPCPPCRLLLFTDSLVLRLKQLRQLSTVVGSKVQVLMSLEECKS